MVTFQQNEWREVLFRQYDNLLPTIVEIDLDLIQDTALVD